jgi:hypothetical protein
MVTCFGLLAYYTSTNSINHITMIDAVGAGALAASAAATLINCLACC